MDAGEGGSRVSARGAKGSRGGSRQRPREGCRAEHGPEGGGMGIQEESARRREQPEEKPGDEGPEHVVGAVALGEAAGPGLGWGHAAGFGFKPPGWTGVASGPPPPPWYVGDCSGRKLWAPVKEADW